MRRFGVATVLVVDDSSIDRQIVQGLLKSEPDLTVQFADNGAAALIQINQSVPDVVVTDLVMPEADGLQVVRTVRDQFPDVPVILMTAKGSEAIAIEALERGAASYVPKSRLTDRLLDTVQQVLALKQGDHPYGQLMQCLSALDFSLRLKSRLTLIPQLVDLIRRALASLPICDATESIRVSLAVEEALLNALVHGNLELTSQLQDRGLNPHAEFFKNRCAEAPFRDRHVHVRAAITLAKAEFVVRDEGPGFAVSSLPDPTDLSVLQQRHGRGLRLMRTFMDEVIYSRAGNEVTLIKTFVPRAGGGPSRPM
jgi:CheY-like chemotaxis protein/anti-sigma regulatory factor (Ser/Thr protein kinase)